MYYKHKTELSSLKSTNMIVKNNESFILVKKLTVHSKIYPSVSRVPSDRRDHNRQLFFCKEYDSFMKNFPKAVDELKPEEFYDVDIFLIPGGKSVSSSGCMEFAKQYTNSLVGIQGISGEWKSTKEDPEDPTTWIDSNDDFWSPQIFTSSEKEFEFNLGCFHFHPDAPNYLIIFYLLD